MAKCINSFVYEQSGNEKLILCIQKEYCSSQGDSFTSSEDGIEYRVCKTNGNYENNSVLDGLERVTDKKQIIDDFGSYEEGQIVLKTKGKM